MKAIILAGGLGTRLRPLTETTPKPLLPIKGKPMVERALANFKKHGVTDIILSIGYLSDKIKAYFGDGAKFGVNISYCVEESPLGTGGAVKQAAKGISEPFLLQWGDNLMDIDWQGMLDFHFKNNAQITIALTPRADVEHFGAAKLDGDKIITFAEKPQREQAPSNLINAGAFVISPGALAILPDNAVCSIERDCFEKLAPQERVFGFRHWGQWFPTDTMEKYRKADEEFVP